MFRFTSLKQDLAKRLLVELMACSLMWAQLLNEGYVQMVTDPWLMKWSSLSISRLNRAVGSFASSGK